MNTPCQEYALVWPAPEQDIAQAVCMAESQGDPAARNARPPIEDSRGLWQVNSLAHPQYDRQALFDPAYNAAAALEIWRSQGWAAWGAYTAGTYRQYLAGAPPPPVAASPDASSRGALLLALAAVYHALEVF